MSIKQLHWQTIVLSEAPTLGEANCHIWCIELANDDRPLLLESQQADANTFLSDIQWDKYQRRKVGLTRNTYLAGRYWLLRLLSVYKGIEPTEIKIAYNRLNKPYLEPSQGALQFNFSDSVRASEHGKTSVGMYAFCLSNEVGIDLEAGERSIDFDRLAARRFTPTEQEFMNAGDAKQKMRRCLQIWTRKEASGKARGLGINFQMNELNLIEGDRPELTFIADDQHWALQQFSGPKQEIGCIVTGGEQPLEIQAFTVSEPF
ncbi:MAG: 4'-phosphopantetheinyl transferase superfamily protein [Pseudomonadota bacterium]